MKKNLLILFTAGLLTFSCNQGGNDQSQATSDGSSTEALTGQSGVKDDVSAKNIVQVAIGSKDHTTLVKAVQAAELVDVLSNAGPFTVFAPTNAAFDKLPAGTLDNLLKPENKETLQDILQYHVFVGVLQAESFQDGQTFNQVNSANIQINVKDGKVMINNAATIVASIPTSNGIIHVIDAVLLPPKS